MVIYAVYKDDGPKGICGQSMSITRKFSSLFIFDDYAKFKNWAESVGNITVRLRPRIEDYWIVSDMHPNDDVVDRRDPIRCNKGESV